MLDNLTLQRQEENYIDKIARDNIDGDIKNEVGAFRNVCYMQKSLAALFLEKLYQINEEVYEKVVDLVHEERMDYLCIN